MIKSYLVHIQHTNKNCLFVFIVFCTTLNWVFSQNASLCNQSIALQTINTTDKTIDNRSEKIYSMFRSLLINSEKCELITRDRLGDLINYIDLENRLPSQNVELPQSTLQLFLKRDVDYIAFVSSSTIRGSRPKAGLSRIVFYSTLNGVPDIEMEIPYSIDEIEKADQLVKDRLEAEFLSRLECDFLETKVAKLKKEVSGLEESFREVLTKQEFECQDLRGILNDEEEIERIKKRNKSIYRYLIDQGATCDDLLEVSKDLEEKSSELDNAVAEKERKDAKEIEEKAKEEEIRRREQNVENEQREIQKAKRLDVGNPVKLSCLLSIPYYEVALNDFSRRFRREHFVQFATFPTSGYKSCEFIALYNYRRNTPVNQGPFIYLVNQGVSVARVVRLRAVIGPFNTYGEAQTYLTKVRQHYRDAKITSF